jgi:hypothetical protein
MTDIFTTPETPSQEQPVQTNALDTMLASIKNEQGNQKYDSVEKALEALQHSQEFIPTLKSQLQEKDTELSNLRMEISKQQGINETIERLSTASQDPVQPKPEQEVSQDIESIVANLLQSHQTQSAEESNKKQVNDTVVALYGDKAGEYMLNKSKELGMSLDALESMAKQSPQAALKLLEVEGKTSHNVSSVNAGNYRTDNLAPRKEELSLPETSLMSGPNSSKNRIEFMKKVRADVYNKLGVVEQ